MNKRSEFANVDQYIKASPKAVQNILWEIRKLVHKAAPEAVESISYQMPAFKLNGKPLVYFAAFKNHIGFYPTPSGTATFKKELAQYKGGKGSVRFPLTQPIPYDLLQRIVSFRVREIQDTK